MKSQESNSMSTSLQLAMEMSNIVEEQGRIINELCKALAQYLTAEEIERMCTGAQGR